MLQSRNLLKYSRAFLAQQPKTLTQKNVYALNHVRNMLDENLKYEVEQIQNGELQLEKTGRVYKPSQTIEFNRVGEVLLYSCDPLSHVSVYFKYPYIFYESFAPALLWSWFYNPLELSWAWNNMSLFALSMIWIPRMWYFRSLNYKVRKLSLLRGGKVIKVETNTLANDQYSTWVETYQCNPLTECQQRFDDRDNADFLEEKGQLKYELAVQCDHFQEMGTTTQDVVIEFMKEGLVHEPELFEAVLKGYNVDTSDFVINTANNFRSREGHYNQ